MHINNQGFIALVIEAHLFSDQGRKVERKMRDIALNIVS
jgi:hypothetical protein